MLHLTCPAALCLFLVFIEHRNVNLVSGNMTVVLLTLSDVSVEKESPKKKSRSGKESLSLKQVMDLPRGEVEHVGAVCVFRTPSSHGL